MSQQDKNIVLRGPGDWVKWQDAFEWQAKTLYLWDNLVDRKPQQNEDGTTTTLGPLPFLERPIMPTPEEFQSRPRLLQQQSQSRSQTQRRGQPNRRGHPSHGRTPSPVSEIQASSSATIQHTRYTIINTLDDKDARKFATAMNLYYNDRRQFTEQGEAIRKVMDWITSHVADTYLRTCCNPSDSLDVWYKNLCEEFKLATEEARISAFHAYHEATKPLTRAPKDWYKWLAAWEDAMSTGKSVGLAETSDPVSWFEAFIKAIQKPAEHWVDTFKTLRRREVGEGKISYRDLSDTFRREFIVPRQGERTAIMKGSFPTLHAGHPASGSDSEEPAPAPKAATKRKRKIAPAASKDLCIVCELPHHDLLRCYYAFPDQAPSSGWKPSPRRQATSKANLKKAEVLHEIARLKGKRV